MIRSEVQTVAAVAAIFGRERSGKGPATLAAFAWELWGIGGRERIRRLNESAHGHLSKRALLQREKDRMRVAEIARESGVPIKLAARAYPPADRFVAVCCPTEKEGWWML